MRFGGGGGRVPAFIIAWSVFNHNVDGLVFYSLGSFSTLLGAGGEILTDNIITRPLILRRHQVITGLNGKDEISNVSVRDDAVSIGTIALPALSANTRFDSGPLDVAIAAGSRVNYLNDTSLSTNLGNIQILSIQLEFDYG